MADDEVRGDKSHSRLLRIVDAALAQERPTYQVRQIVQQLMHFVENNVAVKDIESFFSHILHHTPTPPLPDPAPTHHTGVGGNDTVALPADVPAPVDSGQPATPQPDAKKGVYAEPTDKEKAGVGKAVGAPQPTPKPAPAVAPKPAAPKAASPQQQQP